MERISLAKMQEQIDSLKANSLPQVKRFLRKRIRRALNEAKAQANSVKKTIESVASSTGSSSSSSAKPDGRRLASMMANNGARVAPTHPAYDQFGWGSDFDDDDDDDDDDEEDDIDDEEDDDQYRRNYGDSKDGDNCNTTRNTRHDDNSAETTPLPTIAQPPSKSLSTSLSVLCLHKNLSSPKPTPASSKCKPSSSLGAHSISLQSLPMKSRLSLRSSGSSSSSSTLSSISKRPVTEPPPPPLPREPPPQSGIDRLTLYLPINNGPNETYETVTFNENDNDEYLLPITAGQNGAYEYVPFVSSQSSAKNSRTGSSGWESLSSHSSSSFNRYEVDTYNDRPLPPIPDSCGDDVEAMLLKSFSWFHSIEREEAERLLKKMGVDGVYLVRPSKRAGASSPYTLTLFYSARIFHLNIRKRVADGQFALGMEKPREKTFRSVAELIEHHNSEPIFLTSKGRPAGKTRLLYTPS